jgi:hypothetical protein
MVLDKYVNDKTFAQIFNSIICYIDDVPSLNNTRFGAMYIHRIYSNELEEQPSPVETPIHGT